MEYQAQTIQTAADRVIQKKLQNLGGNGGVVAMDKMGNMAISFNTEGMYRAYINSDGNGRGFLNAEGSHSLENFVTEVAREIEDRVAGVPVAELVAHQARR